jgi:hypothetical protein
MDLKTLAKMISDEVAKRSNLSEQKLPKELTGDYGDYANEPIGGGPGASDDEDQIGSLQSVPTLQPDEDPRQYIARLQAELSRLANLQDDITKQIEKVRSGQVKTPPPSKRDPNAVTRIDPIRPEVTRVSRTSAIKEASGWSELSDNSIDDTGKPRTTKYQDAISVLKFFLEERPEPGSPESALISNLDNMINVGRQLETAQLQLQSPQDFADMQARIKDPHVHQAMANLLINSGLPKDKIMAFIAHLSPTVSSPKKVKKAMQGDRQSLPPQNVSAKPASVSPTGGTQIKPSTTPRASSGLPVNKTVAPKSRNRM